MVQKKLIYLSIFLFLFYSNSFSQWQKLLKEGKDVDVKYLSESEREEYWKILNNRFKKANATRTRANARSIILSGNQVQTIIYDYGSISKPGLSSGQLIDLAWPKDPTKAMGYGYEFGPLVGAQVRDTSGHTIRVVDDGFISPSDGSYEPGTDVPWGWLPTPGYVDPNQSNIAKLAALTGNLGSTRTAALSQQAQNAALQSAIGKAAEAQQQDKLGQQALAEGQKQQAKSYTDANTKIQKNQTDALNKLQDNGTKANKELTDLYNNTNTNLTKGAQDYVNRAQDILRKATIPPQAIKTAVQSFADVVGNYVRNNKLNDKQKSDLRNELESVWRISVGSHPADMEFSDQIAKILNPIVGNIT